MLQTIYAVSVLKVSPKLSVAGHLSRSARAIAVLHTRAPATAKILPPTVTHTHGSVCPLNSAEFETKFWREVVKYKPSLL